MAEKKKRKKKKPKSSEAAAEEALRAKARELWDDPERELDEYDLELARLQGEMEEEDEAKEAARAAEVRKRKETAARRAAKAEADAIDAAEGTKTSHPPKAPADLDSDASDSEEASGDGSTSEQVAEAVAAGKKKVEAGARDAAGEVAGEAMRSGKGVGDAALTVVKRRLPALPSKEKVRNLALGVGGAGIGIWLLWGLIAPVFAWTWWLTKWGVMGALGYTAFVAYGALPSREGDEAPGAEAVEDGTEDDEE